MRGLRRLRLLGLVLLSTVAGCVSLTPEPPPAPVTYDLGPAPESAPDAGALLVEVSAPAWLDQPAMRYRLAYADPRQVSTYTRSRWVAPPPRLLGQHLRQTWRGPALGDCRLALGVDEWVHQFDGADRSRVVIAIDARLLDRAGSLVARRALRRDATPARHDAPGMAAASRMAVDGLVEDLAGWLGDPAAGRATACSPR